ncbi:hypothetical protein [uncultured Propionibacterium sp.]|uniref:electron transfer flavoprotein subunit beta/FixA family protein n=1 Tax=uncultured Propionibacterium sp. TaxID=218066 RepID=UPI002931D07C|nr:hypothetical protein [uncultured Propionibacterium sp.]
MKTVVIYKWARDVQNASVRADGTIDWRGEKVVPGEDDPAAVAAALELTGPDDELIGLTIGAGDASWALARGVPRAVSVTDAPFSPDDASVTAMILAAAVAHIGDVDVVVIGDATEFPGVAPTLAGRLGAVCLTQVLTAGPDTGGGVNVSRQNGDMIEYLRAPIPVVLGVCALGADTRRPGMKEQLAARKRPVTKLTLADLDVTAPRTVTATGLRPPEATEARVFSGDDAAADLIAALRSEGVLS